MYNNYVVLDISVVNNKHWENIFHSPGKYFFETIVFYKPQIDPLAVFAEARNSEDKVHVIYGPRGKLAARAPAARAAVARTRATRRRSPVGPQLVPVAIEHY